jgi:hypothetical protein
VGVSLGGRDSRVAEDLLDDTDVHALLDEERRGGVVGVVDADVSDAGLLEDGLPELPVLGSFDRSAVLGGEHQIVMLPALPCFFPLGVLDFTVGLELGEEGAPTPGCSPYGEPGP